MVGLSVGLNEGGRTGFAVGLLTGFAVGFQEGSLIIVSSSAKVSILRAETSSSSSSCT